MTLAPDHYPWLVPSTTARVSMLTPFNSSPPVADSKSILLGVGIGLLISCLGPGARFCTGGNTGVSETERVELAPAGEGEALGLGEVVESGGMLGECLTGERPDIGWIVGD